ncbi:organic cation transporter protein-like [Eriocheir sinensis]|uniref:organic cation transporter protein-like n=1 Tax=Eriocheir sinensis TaxID=95602 RepID=UPI0021C6AA09|nr:organic cation transporter protein-like [Eriocheir sinensis]XP_050697769.1 organic cation transporter protein-like [Eriocheir sinensis]XP_050697770.1 organic cation transporter protein-like [Eriocheir sinensis]XP_050697771.1 organic cation transporter protein-like [Eriocheir sinensis]XP_050697773.1 organic cation transporter protein-like [Eriocheir sinensis]
MFLCSYVLVLLEAPNTNLSLCRCACVRACVMSASHLDKLMTHLGTGRWSVFHFLALSYSNMLITPHTFGRPFLAPKLDFTCISDAYNTTTATTTTATAITTTTAMFPTDLYNLTEVDQCFEADGVTPCTEWSFDSTTYTSTITAEMQLVCSREHLRTAYQSVYLVGVFFGAPVSGFLADRYGRRRMVCWSIFLYVVLSIASAWLPGIGSILVTRFILGFLHAVLLLVTYILVVEIAEPRRRSLLGLTVYIVFALSVVAWGGVAYALRDWRILQTVASLPGLLLLPCLWFLDESPRWLAVQGRAHDALAVLRKAARWHGAKMPKDVEVLAMLRAEAATTAAAAAVNRPHQTAPKTFKTRLRAFLKESVLLMSTPYLRKISLLMFVVYMFASMVYFGLSLSGGTLSDNPFVYMSLAGLMEVPAYTLTVPVVDRLGRRWPGVACFVFCGLALLALAAIPEEQSQVVMTLALLGKMTNSVAFMIFYFQSSELSPTEVRSRGLGTCQCWSRIGGILAPYILDFVGASRPWATSVVFGAGSLLAALCVYLLPETKGVALPDTVAKSEDPHHHHRHRHHQLIQHRRGSNLGSQHRYDEDEEGY